MTFEIGNLRLSDTATTGLAGAEGINNAAEAALARSKMWKEGMKDVYDIYPMTDSSAGQSSLLSDAGSLVSGLGESGLFDNLFSGKSETDKMVERDNKMYGNTFPKGSFGITKGADEQAANWWDGLLGGWG
jgi:hypothetical protein